ncbi:MAG: ribonuclease HIII [Candidatus Cloacimonetes bacterium]|nr:ribonuclease HIII [Candidatus Cloacimonadota bacterium]
MHPEIENYLSHLYPLLAQRGIEILWHKEIAYGIQLKLSRDIDSANLNIYYGKKGLSTLVGGSKDSALKQEIGRLVGNIHSEPASPALHHWHYWIGSDECGKGDYFGPLVLSAFYLKQEQVPELRQLGTVDSKRLNDTKLKTIAESIYRSFPGQCQALIISPRRYNELISDFKRQNLNLNDLLAWAHSKVISELIAKSQPLEGVIIDQFSKAQKARARLIAKYPRLNIIERTAAERDPAVAAASILARYQFLIAKKNMEKSFGFNFPLGAGANVKKAAQTFVTEQGMNKLGEVAKLHFKTTLALRS